MLGFQLIHKVLTYRKDRFVWTVSKPLLRMFSVGFWGTLMMSEGAHQSKNLQQGWMQTSESQRDPLGRKI